MQKEQAQPHPCAKSQISTTLHPHWYVLSRSQRELLCSGQRTRWLLFWRVYICRTKYFIACVLQRWEARSRYLTALIAPEGCGICRICSARFASNFSNITSSTKQHSILMPVSCAVKSAWSLPSLWFNVSVYRPETKSHMRKSSWEMLALIYQPTRHL
jgi:hypothetical protein